MDRKKEGTDVSVDRYINEYDALGHPCSLQMSLKNKILNFYFYTTTHLMPFR